MKLLILGGTADARKIASRLITANITVVYSIAGLVRKPQLDCEIISGGFSKTGGLEKYLVEHNIDAVLDATHPYAMQMSAKTQQACKNLSLKLWRFCRVSWLAQKDDQWIDVSSWQQLIDHCGQYDHPFLTTGQLDQSQLDTIANNSTKVLYRTAAASNAQLATKVTWIKAIGPFALTSELAVMRQHQVDVVVCKNAGGESTYAKLVAARILKLPVIMLERPDKNQLSLAIEFSSLDTITKAIIDNK